MIEFYSNKTKEKYNSLEAAEAAEKAFDEKVAAEQKKKEELAATRKADADVVDKAYKDMIDAQKAYREALDKFVKKYGSYHKTYSWPSDKILDTKDIFNLFWF